MFYRLIRLALVAACVVSLCPAAAAPLPVVRIATLTDGIWQRPLVDFALFQAEIQKLLEGEFDVQFPAQMQLTGDWNPAHIQQQLDRLLSNKRVDLIIAQGVLASNEAAHRSVLSKPVIAPIIINPEIQGLPVSGGASGIKNLNYLASFKSFERDMVAYQELVPIRHLAVFIDRLVLDAFPNLPKHGAVRPPGMEVDMTFIAVDEDIETAIAQLPDTVDAVYITPLMRISSQSFQQLVNALIQRRLPSFSLFGRDEVELGVMAASAPASDTRRLARRVALNVQRILLGEDAGTLDVSFARRERITINMATVRRINRWPSWQILAESALINETPKRFAVTWSLGKVMREAVTTNIELAASSKEIAAAGQAVREARAQLLPQVDAQLTARTIDRDRANAALGNSPQRLSTSSLVLSQSIYSEPIWANFDVLQDNELQTQYEYERLRLDIALQAALGYLDVLRTKTFEGIQKDNLQLTRSNYELAQVRQAIGMSAPAEVYRWQSEIARQRQDLVLARAQVRQAEVTLNQRLHRPLEQAFATEDASIDDGGLLTSQSSLFRYVDNPGKFVVFRDFMVDEGLRLLPEIKVLETAISAQLRVVKSTQRSFWVPEVGLQAELSRELNRDGAGVATAPGIELDDQQWTAGLNVTLPVFTGGRRGASLARARDQLHGLRLQLAAVKEQLELATRNALHATQASYSGIRLSRQAAQAAQKNLELVTDSYSRGMVSILDLLDAQNARLVADQNAANAVYNFLIDFLRMQRSIGRFDHFMTDQEKQQWKQRMAAYYAQRGMHIEGLSE